MLAAHFGPLIDRPVPEAWTLHGRGPAKVVWLTRRVAGRRSRPLLALAASVLLLIAGVAGYQPCSARRENRRSPRP